MTERKLATVRVIAEVKPIEGADKICAYRTGSVRCTPLQRYLN